MKKLILIGSLITSINAHALGYVDIFSPSNYSGWGCDSNTPEESVGIHIWRDDNQFLGGGAANIPREQAVANACKSASASHGFNITLSISSQLIDNKAHKVHLYTVTADGRVQELSNSPVTVQFGSAPPPPPPEFKEICSGDPIEYEWIITGIVSRSNACGSGSNAKNNVFQITNGKNKESLSFCAGQRLPENWFIQELQTNYNACGNSYPWTENNTGIIINTNNSFLAQLDVCTRYGDLPPNWKLVTSYTQYGSCGSGATAYHNRMVIRDCTRLLCSKNQ